MGGWRERAAPRVRGASRGRKRPSVLSRSARQSTSPSAMGRKVG
jgi:hypothetical protein